MIVDVGIILCFVINPSYIQYLFAVFTSSIKFSYGTSACISCDGDVINPPLTLIASIILVASSLTSSTEPLGSVCCVLIPPQKVRLSP